jgi:DNA segregation ATPase FtsK/SpoIIIE-like protein
MLWRNFPLLQDSIVCGLAFYWYVLQSSWDFVFSFTQWLFLLLDPHRECGSSHIEALILEYMGSVVLELQQSWQQLISAIHDRRWWIWCSVSSSSHKFATTVIWWSVASKCIVVTESILCNLSWTWSLWYCHANDHTSSGSADSLPLITSLNCSLFWVCFHVGFFYTFDCHLTCS